MRVTGLAITAVKATRLRAVESIELTEAGARGNREFFVVDDRDRMVNGKQLGELQSVVASYAEPELTLAFPGGEVVADEVHYDGGLRARFFSRMVEGRLVAGPWASALSERVGREVRLVHAPGSVDRGARGAATLSSQASLEALAGAAGVDAVDGRRFRMLIEIDGVGPHEEDQWVGRRSSIGSSAIVHWRGHVGRCLTTSRDPESGEVDLPTLDILRDYRAAAETTDPLPFGIYGEVVAPGEVRVGDPVTSLPPQ